ncbi:unnamed protein product [Chrysoparadoxa australica]
MASRIVLWFFKGTGQDRRSLHSVGGGQCLLQRVSRTLLKLTDFLLPGRTLAPPGLIRSDSREFYTLLNVEQDADASAIKRAYKRRSLEMHPDKLNQKGHEVTDEDRAQFQRMKEGYEILSDPERRKVYDEMGEAGIKMMEDPASAFGPDQLMNNFTTMRNRDRLRLCLFVLLLVGTMLLYPILLCAKIDGDIGGSWAAIWIPLWAYDLLGLYALGYAVSLGKMSPPEGLEDEWEEPSPLIDRVKGLVTFCLFVLFQVLLVVRLDGHSSMRWGAVFIPMFLWESVTAATNLRDGCCVPLPEPDGTESAEQNEDEEEAFSPYAQKLEAAVEHKAEATKSAVKSLMRLWQLAFLVVKLDMTVSWNWWAVFSPLWVYLGFLLVLNLLECYMAREVKAEALKTEDANVAARAEAIAQEMSSHAFYDCCGWSIMFVISMLLVARLQSAGYSVFVVISPILAMACLLVCCMSCAICCVRDMEGMDLDEEMGEAQGPLQGKPQESSPTSDPATYGTYQPPPAQDLLGAGPPKGDDQIAVAETTVAAASSGDQVNVSVDLD